MAAKRVLFLMSDTGGGHRAAAEAIREALYILYGNHAVEVALVDVFRHSLFPLNYMPEFYPWIINNSKASWGIGYDIANTKPSTDVITKGIYLTNGRRLRRMVRNNPADVVVSVHSVITRPSMSAFIAMPKRPPFITVVTDLVTTPMFWYDPRVEKCFVPTQTALNRGLMCGMHPDQMQVTGLPVHPRFNNSLVDKATARRELGWDAVDVPVIMLVAGGDGMGPLYETARGINDRRLNCQLAIICGRNEELKTKLENADWNQPTHIYGFVDDMPHKMSGADILVTKAGPATISEACIAGLPVILSDMIPGQEEGNVKFVVEQEAGIFAPSPELVANAVQQWLSEGKDGLKKHSDNARRLGKPNAVWDIAEAVWQYAHLPPIQTPRRPLINEILDGNFENILPSSDQ